MKDQSRNEGNIKANGIASITDVIRCMVRANTVNFLYQNLPFFSLMFLRGSGNIFNARKMAALAIHCANSNSHAAVRSCQLLSYVYMYVKR